METSDSPVRVLRLKTGEDVVAEITVSYNKKTEKKQYSLTNPLRLIYMMGNNGTSITVGMIEWVFPRVSEMTSFTIREDDVLVVMIPTKSIQKYYFDYLNNSSSVEDEDSPKEESNNLLENIVVPIKGKLN